MGSLIISPRKVASACLPEICDPSIPGPINQQPRSWPQTGMWEITSDKSASIRQPHWHRHLDVKRPSRALEELRQLAATRTGRRLLAYVDFRHEMRPIAFVDPGALRVPVWRNSCQQTCGPSASESLPV